MSLPPCVYIYCNDHPKRRACKGAQKRARVEHRSLCPIALADAGCEKDERMSGRPGEHRGHLRYVAMVLERLMRPSEMMRQQTSSLSYHQKSYHHFPTD